MFLVFSSWQLKIYHLRLSAANPFIFNWILRNGTYRNNELAEARSSLWRISSSKLLLTLYLHPKRRSRGHKFDADEYWNMVDTPVRCLTHHLKTVEVAELVMEKQVIQFL